MRTSASPSEGAGPAKETLRARFSAPGPEVLDRLIDDGIPELALDPPVTRYFREIYFDTAERDLERRGALASVRLEADAAPVLSLELSGPGASAPRMRHAVSPAAHADPAAALTGDGEAVRQLRAMVDPARLLAWLELEVHRRTRRDPGTGASLSCDAVVAREAETRAELWEVMVELPAGLGRRRKRLRALEADFGLLPAAGPLALRATQALSSAAADLLAEAVRAARRVAVVAWADGCVALQRDGRALRVAVGEGTGEDAARRVLRERWQQAGARIRLLGVAPGSAGRPATEVWLAEGASGPLEPRSGVEVVSLPLAELLATVGTPALRDEATLAALQVLARSELPVEPGSGPPAVLQGGAADPLVEPVTGAAALPAGALLNMELSTLAFDRRVLALAADPEVPLMERVRFLAIFSANLDEFFRVRVGGFKRQVAEGSGKRTLDGATPEAQLDAIAARSRALVSAAHRLLHDELLPGLEGHGIHVLHPAALLPEEERALDERYEREVHPVLTPLASGPGQPFPHIRNLRPVMAAILEDPVTGTERLGMVELPDGIPRFIPLDGGHRFLPLEDVIGARLGRLFPGSRVVEAGVFRVTRSAELHLRGRTDQDLLHLVQEEVTRRRFRPVVRLEVEERMPPRLRELLLRELRYEAADRTSTLSDADVYVVPSPLDLRAVRELAVLEGEGLTYPPLTRGEPLPANRPVLEVLREGDRLVSFPEDSFEATVERFVREAAEDPDVLAIKLALYRTNRRSRVVEALRRASAAGKQVAALVELTARFDEERNIAWARHLRRHGIHVIYGPPGTKVHAKIALVVRREADGLRRYAYVGTGNLNAQTAAAYTDLGLLTADPVLAADVAEVFNLLTSGSGPPRLSRLLVAPFNMREGFLERIRREAEHGQGGHIRAKFNGLADREMVAALYEASRAGVRVELIVRSLCVLRPGVPGLSENIRVISVLGRHLEHARVYRFGNGGDPEYFIGSADWRTRNLSRRVEVAAPVREPEHRARLDALLDAQWNHPRAWELGADGTYHRRGERA